MIFSFVFKGWCLISSFGLIDCVFIMRSHEILIAIGVVFVALPFLPIVVLLYCIPSIRVAFDQLVYEDAMRG